MADMIKKGVHGCSKEESYIAPTDPLILERLEWFRDQKLALMMHFGPYSQMAAECSWCLSEEDSWARGEVDWEDDLETFRKQYWDLNKSFNPVRLQPDKIAQFAADNGFKYLIFTTKHHDGFCMFETEYSDYKVTAPDCPFHTHKYANVTKAMFDAFREKGLGIAAYFSKPDWHCPWYWAEGMEKPVGKNRRPTYKPEEHPEIWEAFTQYTHNQLMELVENYGKLDILWLDGGTVRPSNGYDIRLSELVEKARKVQPWLITADRTAATENENYITPEQAIPDRVIHVPWESCITVGKRWIYRYNDNYKSSRTLVRMLIEVVSRGGNLAINIGPQADGRLPLEAVKEVEGLGGWLKVNGEAIYGTRALETAQIEGVMYTKKGDALYALMPLNEEETLGKTLLIPTDREIKEVICLDGSISLPFEKTDKGVKTTLPDEMVGTCPYAVAFKLI